MADRTPTAEKALFDFRYLRITEAAARAAFAWIGRGDKNAADGAAVNAMRAQLHDLNFAGRIVAGEGARDDAPAFEQDESFADQDAFDMAVDPLDGTRVCAAGGSGALSALTIAPKGHILKLPDIFMHKIAVGPDARGAIDLRRSYKENLYAIAEAKHKPVNHMSVMVMDRPYNQSLIQEIRACGARVYQLGDGDIYGAISTCYEMDTPIDALMGIGGAVEGLLAVSAIQALGGDFQGRLYFRNDVDRQLAAEFGFPNDETVFLRDELVKEPALFCATGVTTGHFLKGVQADDSTLTTHSVWMDSSTRTVRHISTQYPEPR